MSFVIQAMLNLKPGCRLYYACPPSMAADDWRTNQFFEKYRGKYARYLGPSEKLYGPLNHEGRLPGRYADPTCINVRFEEEANRIYEDMNILHFVVCDTDPAHVSLTETLEDDRLGDFPSILFYPQDLVRLKRPPKGWTDVPRQVTSLCIDKRMFVPWDGLPRYQVYHNEDEHRARVAKRPFDTFPASLVLNGDGLEFIARGNVWALYNDPARLAFSSDEHEYDFWTTDGISKIESGLNPPSARRDDQVVSSATGVALEMAWQSFLAGRVDLIEHYKEVRVRNMYRSRHLVYKLHDIFAEHRERVRALCKRVWEPRLSQDAA